MLASSIAGAAGVLIEPTAMKRFTFAAVSMIAVLRPACAQDRSDQPAMPNDLVHAMATSSKGALAIRAVQGTEGGPPVAGDPVEVVVFHRNQAVKQVSATLDERGMVIINDLPVSIGIRALVRVRHAGVVYQDAGPLMNDGNPRASMEITVNEITDDPPPWRIKVRQAAAAVVSNGIDVAETVVVENPVDKTWIGEPADAQGRRATVRLTLPDDAVEVELIQGFHGWCCSAYVPPVLTVQMPMMPGQTNFKFAYKIPVRHGASSLLVSSAVPTEHAVFVVPALGVVASGRGATPAGASIVEGVETVRFEGGPLGAGEVVGLALSGVELPALPNAAAHVPEPAQAGGSPKTAYWIIGGTGLACAIAVGAWTLHRRGGAARHAESPHGN